MVLEPRFQINGGLDSQLIFGMDVDKWTGHTKITFNEEAFGYPIERMESINPGEYYVQALLHTYETFNLVTGQTVKLPMDNGEGQKWNRSPGNLYSKPFKITIEEKGVIKFDIELDQIIADIDEPADTEWIKHIKLKSQKLSLKTYASYNPQINCLIIQSFF